MRGVHVEHEGRGLLAWHGWDPSGLVVAKVCTIIPGNTAGPAVQALVDVFDAATGAPVAVIDGTELTYWKTASVSAMAATYLARPDAEVLVMVGAGALAAYLVDAHRAVRPSLATVLVWNRDPAKAEALADRVGGTAVTDLEAACRDASVVSCATAATAPLVRGQWLAPGTHLDLVGGFSPPMREADDDAVRRSTLVVDHAATIDAAGDLCHPVADGVCRRADIADLFDLASGRHPGRTSGPEITLFKSAGGGHLDLFAAGALLGDRR